MVCDLFHHLRWLQVSGIYGRWFDHRIVSLRELFLLSPREPHPVFRNEFRPRLSVTGLNTCQTNDFTFDGAGTGITLNETPVTESVPGGIATLSGGITVIPSRPTGC